MKDTVLCPCCGNTLERDAARCTLCGMDRLDQIFLSQQDYCRWEDEVLKPYQKVWEEREKRRKGKWVPQIISFEDKVLILTRIGALYEMNSLIQKEVGNLVLVEENIWLFSKGKHGCIYITEQGSVKLYDETGGNRQLYPGDKRFEKAKNVAASKEYESYWVQDACGNWFGFGDNCMEQITTNFTQDLKDEPFKQTEEFTTQICDGVPYECPGYEYGTDEYWDRRFGRGHIVDSTEGFRRIQSKTGWSNILIKELDINNVEYSRKCVKYEESYENMTGWDEPFVYMEWVDEIVTRSGTFSCRLIEGMVKEPVRSEPPESAIADEKTHIRLYHRHEGNYRNEDIYFELELKENGELVIIPVSDIWEDPQEDNRLVFREGCLFLLSGVQDIGKLWVDDNHDGSNRSKFLVILMKDGRILYGPLDSLYEMVEAEKYGRPKRCRKKGLTDFHTLYPT